MGLAAAHMASMASLPSTEAASPAVDIQATATTPDSTLQQQLNSPMIVGAPVQLEHQLTDLAFAVDTGWIILCGALVFTMQAGFTFLEAGFVKKRNIQSILMKNLIDAAMAGIAWYLLGYGIAFGEEYDFGSQRSTAGGASVSPPTTSMTLTGFFGSTLFLPSSQDFEQHGGSYTDFFFQYTFCATAATIVSGGVAERCKLQGFAAISFLLTLLFYPTVVHWTWGGGWLKQIGFTDFAGSGIVHMFGGFAALVGAVACGPRHGRFFPSNGSAAVLDNANSSSTRPADHSLGQELLQRKIRGGVGGSNSQRRDHAASQISISSRSSRALTTTVQPPPTEVDDFAPTNMLYICVGSFILWFGWYGFNAGSTNGLTNGKAVTAARVATNTATAAAFGTVSSFLVNFIRVKKFDIAAFANGMLGGLVGITAGCASVDLWDSMVIGIISGVVVEFATVLLLTLEIDDPVAAFPVHGACGIWGLLAVGLFDEKKGFFKTATANTPPSTALLHAQVIGLFAITIWAVVTCGLTFYLLKFTDNLVVSAEHQLFGIDLVEFTLERRSTLSKEHVPERMKNFRMDEDHDQDLDYRFTAMTSDHRSQQLRTTPEGTERSTSTPRALWRVIEMPPRAVGRGPADIGAKATFVNLDLGRGRSPVMDERERPLLEKEGRPKRGLNGSNSVRTPMQTLQQDSIPSPSPRIARPQKSPREKEKGWKM
ncbi:unnamed protein product [Amoebophrya sp. A120]|nr:unnamed protein product [Amoebophrya sp. A120]|eukprot:GSA120T00007571001.1